MSPRKRTRLFAPGSEVAPLHKRENTATLLLAFRKNRGSFNSKKPRIQSQGDQGFQLPEGFDAIFTQELMGPGFVENVISR